MGEREMKVSDLFQSSGVSVQCPALVSLDPDIQAVVYDSRQAVQNTLFVCLKGLNADGHRFAAQAYEGGCRAFLCSDPVQLPPDALIALCPDTRAALAQVSAAFYGFPARQLQLIGITGTKGKTTAANLTYSLLNASGIPAGVIGSNGIDFCGQHFATMNTTPESCEIHKYLRRMVDAGVRAVAMEVSSQALFTHRVDGITFDLAVFTNLSPDHIGYGEHPSFEHYKSCKKSLFSHCRAALFNRDDPAWSDMAQGIQVPFSTYALEGPADFTANALVPQKSGNRLGTAFTLHHKGQALATSLSLPGSFNVSDALAAFACGTLLGLDPAAMAASLPGISVKGRFEAVDALPYAATIIDYAHNEVSLTSLLQTVRSYAPNRILCIFGSVGGRTQHRRKELGEVAGRLADLAVITSDNPNFEDPDAIVQEIAEHFGPSSCPHVCIPDRRQAIRYAMHHAQKGDVLLFCGKGHEDHQLINGVFEPFSERELILETAAEMERTGTLRPATPQTPSGR